MTWILDPSDPVVAAWMRGEPPPAPPTPPPAKTARHGGALVTPERLREYRRKENDRQRALRHARAIAEGREPGVPGRTRRAATRDGSHDQLAGVVRTPADARKGRE